MGIFRDRLEGPAEWAREEPLGRVASGRVPPALPPLYVDCSDRDQFGFYEGARRFVAGLRALKRDVTFVSETGRHCRIDARSAARFLAGLESRR